MLYNKKKKIHCILEKKSFVSFHSKVMNCLKNCLFLFFYDDDDDNTNPLHSFASFFFI